MKELLRLIFRAISFEITNSLFFVILTTWLFGTQISFGRAPPFAQLTAVDTWMAFSVCLPIESIKIEPVGPIFSLNPPVNKSRPPPPPPPERAPPPALPPIVVVPLLSHRGSVLIVTHYFSACRRCTRRCTATGDGSTILRCPCRRHRRSGSGSRNR